MNNLYIDEEWFEEKFESVDKDDKEELKKLEEFKSELEGYGLEYGLNLINDDNFEDYAQELAEDCGLLENCTSWPANCIDWEKAARELQWDYMSVDYEGEMYWFQEA